ncbi:MAG: phosphatase PAP2 family protein [Wenzhouxiangella sp.]|nr:phosphatase PAP2 family protein [Wenzhouxiangella sp.]TVR97640.1 MAG: phosphatase PAP2 family protein [Wenzhouxiangellaceae bacterium]
MDADKLIPSPGLARKTRARIDLLERQVCLICNSLARRTSIRHFFSIVSRLGDGVFWYLLMLSLPFLYGLPGLTVSLQMVVCGMLGLSIYKWLKARTLRERPFAAHPDILCGTAPLDQYSFPSGHTLHAVLFTALAVNSFPALAFILLPFMALVALSRVVLGLHYPSDVAAGAAIGWLMAKIGLWLFSLAGA